MKYTVTIRKEGVGESKSTIEAPSRFAVYEQVQREGGVVIALREERTLLRISSILNISFGTGVSHQEIIRLAKNLSAMLNAGLSLARALSIIERQSNNKFLKNIVVGISASIKQGSSFHEALALYPKVFPSLFVAMVRAGEESGSLIDSLSVVALQMERSEELRRKIRGAMIYPAIVLVAIVIVGILMLIYVVPTLTSTFKALGVALPLSTRIIVALSDFMVAHVFTVLAIIIAVVTSIIYFAKSNIGSRIIIAVSLHIPVIGDMIRETYTARCARTLSSLLSASVPVLEALSITKDVVQTPSFAKVIEEAEVRVRKGETLSASFTEHQELYPILMSDMLAVGEETGNVSGMLKQIAEFYETDVAEKTKDFSTVIEPLLMLFIGAFVGIFAVSMIAPIYSLSSAIS
jgi:type IV pilus assembly protein PilC